MKKTFLIAAMALLLGAANTQAQEWQTIPGMHLSINEMTHDFGTHPQYTKTEFEFNIKNDSTLALVISNISTSCGCTTPTYSKRPVKSGKIATVKAHITRNSVQYDLSMRQLALPPAGALTRDVLMMTLRSSLPAASSSTTFGQ